MVQTECGRGELSKLNCRQGQTGLLLSPHSEEPDGLFFASAIIRACFLLEPLTKNPPLS